MDRSESQHYEMISESKRVLVEAGVTFLCPHCRRKPNLLSVEEYCQGEIHKFGFFCARCGSRHRFERTALCDCIEGKTKITITLVELGDQQDRYWLAQAVDRPEVQTVSKSRERALEDIRLLLRERHDIPWLASGFRVFTETLAVRLD